MTDVSKIVEQATTRKSLEELKAGGVQNVRVITKDRLNELIRAEIEKAARKLTESQKAGVVSAVAKEVGANELALSAKLDELKTLVLEMKTGGKITGEEAKKFLGEADVALASLGKGIEVESNIEETGVEKLEEK